MDHVPQGDDVFELLLPRSGEQESQRAQRVSTFLRLLMHDAGGSQAEVVGSALLDARAVLDAVTRDELVSALEDLLVHYLVAVRSADSFLELPAPKRDLESAWAVLLERRAQVQSSRGFSVRGSTESKPGVLGFCIPGLPQPGESTDATLRRIIEALEALGSDIELWNARLCHALEGPRAAELSLTAMLVRSVGRPQRRIQALQALAASRLERGRPAAAARVLLEESLELVSRSPVLARLAVWSLAFLGREDEAARLAPGFMQRGARLPLGPMELIERQPQFKALLAGKPQAAGALEGGRASSLERELTRGSMGASVLLWIQLGPAHTPKLLFEDVAPDLRGKVEAWLKRRDGAPGRIGEPEQRLLSGARTVFCHSDGEPLKGALDPKRSRSLALVPALNQVGEVVAWMQVECAHHLLPSRSRLSQVCRELEARVSSSVPTNAEASIDTRADLVTVQEAHREFPHSAVAAASKRQEGGGRGPAGILEQAAVSAVEHLGLGLTRRRWCWFQVVSTRRERRLGVGQTTDDLVVVKEGGQASLDAGRTDVHRAALRALRTVAPVVFGEPDLELSRSSQARSGLALPVWDGMWENNSRSDRGRVIAVLSLESTRARDMDEAAAERIMPRLQARAAAWRAARFRSWHLEHFKQDLFIDLKSAAWADIAKDAQRLVHLRTPLSIVGPRGAGKTILARWLHFQRTALAPCIHTWHAGLDRSESDQLGRRAARGCLVVEDLDGLSSDGAKRALAAVEAALAVDAQVLGLARSKVVPSSPEAIELWSRFSRVVLPVPALKERRDELAGMCSQLLGNAAFEEGLELCRPTDAARALLWRQDWPGNVCGLESFLFKLAALGAGRVVDEKDVEAIAGRYGRKLVQRLPSRHPRRECLQAALALTAKKTGAWNKTRAALYLGWDPDTLVRRMADLGIPD